MIDLSDIETKRFLHIGQQEADCCEDVRNEKD